MAKLTSSKITGSTWMTRKNFYVSGTIKRRYSDRKPIWFATPYTYSARIDEVNVPFKTKKLAEEFLAEVIGYDEEIRVAIVKAINLGETPRSAIDNAYNMIVETV